MCNIYFLEEVKDRDALKQEISMRWGWGEGRGIKIVTEKRARDSSQSRCCGDRK
jgi:hypothetical protein